MSEAVKLTEEKKIILPHLKDSFQYLHTMIRDLSQKRFVSMSGHAESAIEEHDKPDDFIYGSNLTVIQIASRDLRMTFKSHFSLHETDSLTAEPDAPPRPKDKALRATCDLFREYNNLVAGGITNELRSCGIVAGISLPLATSGFDEIISSDEISGSKYYDYWKICGIGFHFTCSLKVQIFETSLLEQYVYHGTPDTGSVIEFL